MKKRNAYSVPECEYKFALEPSVLCTSTTLDSLTEDTSIIEWDE